MTQDFDNSLVKVRDIGYTGVEFALGFYGNRSAADLKARLAELGLDPLSSHIMLDAIPGHLDYALELGVKYLIVPMTCISSHEEAVDLAKNLDETGKLCSERGIKLGYHNHRHEFLEGADGYLLETLIKNTDPANVCFQLDVGWATCAGVDCPAFLRKYAGRFALIHVKECAKVAGPEKMVDFGSFEKDENGAPVIPPEILAKFREENKWNVPTGEGIINWNAVRDAAIEQGAEAFIVEREYDYGNDIFDCVKSDCDYLKTL